MNWAHALASAQPLLSLGAFLSRVPSSLNQISFPDNAPSPSSPPLCALLTLPPAFPLPCCVAPLSASSPVSVSLCAARTTRHTTGVILGLLISRDPRKTPPGTRAPQRPPQTRQQRQTRHPPFRFSVLPPRNTAIEMGAMTWFTKRPTLFCTHPCCWGLCHPLLPPCDLCGLIALAAASRPPSLPPHFALSAAYATAPPSSFLLFVPSFPDMPIQLF